MKMLVLFETRLVSRAGANSTWRLRHSQASKHKSLNPKTSLRNAARRRRLEAASKPPEKWTMEEDRQKVQRLGICPRLHQPGKLGNPDTVCMRPQSATAQPAELKEPNGNYHLCRAEPMETRSKGRKIPSSRHVAGNHHIPLQPSRCQLRTQNKRTLTHKVPFSSFA